MAETQILVLVSGASGYIAAHVCQQLGQLGYKVRGTVRDPDNNDKCDPIRALCPGIELVRGDLLSDDNWEEAVSGCDFVIHTASPFPAESPRDESEVIEPAVQGTLRVLRAAKSSSTVKRVILTSSIASISSGHENNPEKIGQLFNEDDWTIIDNPSTNPYSKSKTLAERSAWDFIEQEKPSFDLAVINPGFVIGPFLYPAPTSTSGVVIRRLMQRDYPRVPLLSFGCVDVRDVARAHIEAMKVPEAGGKRFVCVNQSLWLSDISQILRTEFDQHGYRPPRGVLPNWIVRIASWFDGQLAGIVPMLDVEVKYDHSRIESLLGIRFLSLEESLVDMGHSMIEHNMIPRLSTYTGREKNTSPSD